MLISGLFYEMVSITNLQFLINALGVSNCNNRSDKSLLFYISCWYHPPISPLLFHSISPFRRYHHIKRMGFSYIRGLAKKFANLNNISFLLLLLQWSTMYILFNSGIFCYFKLWIEGNVKSYIWLPDYVTVEICLSLKINKI